MFRYYIINECYHYYIIIFFYYILKTFCSHMRTEVAMETRSMLSICVYTFEEEYLGHLLSLGSHNKIHILNFQQVDKCN